MEISSSKGGTTTACTLLTSQPPKVVRACGAFVIFTSNFASLYNGVNFFRHHNLFSMVQTFGSVRILTSRFASRFQRLNFQKCFKHGVFLRLDLATCFAPQWCALFRHLNLQKRSEPAVFFDMLTSTSASRHNDV
jgi:hypothetical protein